MAEAIELPGGKLQRSPRWQKNTYPFPVFNMTRNISSQISKVGDPFSLIYISNWEHNLIFGNKYIL